jgi:multidrug resistance efflux pump
MIARIVPILLVVLALLGLVAYSQYRPVPNKVSGFIEAHDIRLGSRVGGRVAKVLVQEGQPVKRGDVLVELEPFDLLALERQAVAERAVRKAEYDRTMAGLRPEEIEQAKARFDQLQAKLELLEHGPRKQEIEAARAQQEVAVSTCKLAEQNYDRIRGLFLKGASTQEAMDRATEERQTTRHMLIVRQQQLSLLEAGTRDEEIAQARAQKEEARQAWEQAKTVRREDKEAAAAALEAAEAAVAALQARKEELQIVAPVDGIVEALELRPGDLTAPGAPVLSVTDTSEMWVRAYVPENRLDIQLDQRMRVTVDSFPDQEFTGVVTFIAQQAEFTPANVQTPEERSKQVFRIKVTLREGTQQLRPGMAADVWLGGR